MSRDYLVTKAEYKGKGVASLLFREMLNLCKESQLDFIVSVTNPRAISFVKYHLSRGFKIYCKNYNGEVRSYSFIYPLRKFRFVNNALIRYIMYAGLTSINLIRNQF